jgi:general stress protein 26
LEKFAKLVEEQPEMSQKQSEIKKVAKLMKALDYCMMTTRSTDGMRARPMSNNGEVEFDGDVWFFSGADTRKVADIERDPQVHLGYADTENFVFVSMTGGATIVRDEEKKRELWIKELERWFEDGPESEDVVLIKVTPHTVAYWGDDEGEVNL